MSLEADLNPRHPAEPQHQAQLAALQALPTGEQRADLAQLFRFGNAAYRYQQQAAGSVTEDDFEHWLTGLPARIRAVVEREGFAQHQADLSLRRHALERRDIGYAAYMQATLLPADWVAWQAQQPAPADSLPAGT